MDLSFNKCPTAKSRSNLHLSRVDVKLSLYARQRRAEAKGYLKWGLINTILFTIVCYDLWKACPIGRNSIWYKIELTMAALMGLSAVTCMGKYIWRLLVDYVPMCATDLQRTLLDEPVDSLQKLQNRSSSCAYGSDNDELCYGNILNWHSSFEDMRFNSNSSRRCPSPERTQHQSQSQQQQQQHQVHQEQQQQQQQPQQHQQFSNQSFENQSYNCEDNLLDASDWSNESEYVSPYDEVCREDFPTDVRQLPALMRRAERDLKRSYVEVAHDSSIQAMDSSNSYWNYCHNAAYMLKRTIYQLAPPPIPSNDNGPSSIEDFGVVQFRDANSEVIKCISTVELSHYLSNLRYWISTTILQRLVQEIDRMDEICQHRGFGDFKIGCVGLERLRKLAENQQFVQTCAPLLPLVLPFLDTFSNQEYFVQRIRDLAKGSCIGDYRWNSGNAYNGQEWDDHLPTDAAILFHLFCAYLDSQLMPLPQGSGRPFYSRYVIIREEKRSTKDIINSVNNKAHCAILVSNNQMKPKFNFISEKELHNCANDRNNLFYVIIQFLIYMRTHQNSALEGVNLGKTGINIMCVIDD